MLDDVDASSVTPTMTQFRLLPLLLLLPLLAQLYALLLPADSAHILGGHHFGTKTSNQLPAYIIGYANRKLLVSTITTCS